MYVEHMNIVYMIFASMIAASITFLIEGMCCVNIFTTLIPIKRTFFISALLVLSLAGSCAMNRIYSFMLLNGGHFSRIFTNPICVLFLLFAVASMLALVRNQRKINNRAAESGG